ncbi:MAG: beta-CASP ribonuclease aCPSF1 [Candidatus Bathyarchaeia archaeon]
MSETNIKIREEILERIPKEAELSRIEFEGPRIAIYTKRPEVLVEKSYIITEIVNRIRKRIVVRSDPSVRLPEHETEKMISTIVPPEAEITSILFDPTVGEVVVEARKPGLVIGRNGGILQEIIKATRWRVRVLRNPPIRSTIIANTRYYLSKESKERERILRTIGERIFRPAIFKTDDIVITALGGFQEVGRSALFVQTKESRVLLDCGINPGSGKPEEAFPHLDVDLFDLEMLDAVVVSHAHLDHCGFVPFLYKYGYDGPVYCTEPTASLMALLQLDYLDVMSREGVVPPYDQKDVRGTILHTLPLRTGVVTDLTPDIRLTLHNAGHILGSAIAHLHIGEGLHNIVYTGDFKYEHTMLFESAATSFPRVETLVIESTYGGTDDFMPPRRDAEKKFVAIINGTLGAGGKVVIPLPAVGRAQEIMLVLDHYMRLGKLTEAPIYIDGMIGEATAIHTAYPEYLAREVRERIFHQGINPFQSEYFVNVNHPSTRQEIIEGEPSIILTTSGMLEGGPSIEYFKHLAPDERNMMLFVSYQIRGTLGRRVRSGAREVRRINPRPERIIVSHGEPGKISDLVNTLRKKYKYDAYALGILETMRLK